MQKYLDHKDVKLIDDFDDYLLENGLPVVISTHDAAKFISLAEYTKFSNSLTNIAYNLDIQLRRTQLALERAIAEKSAELKSDGVSSSTGRKEALLSGSGGTTTKILELTNSANELESLKWRVIGKINLIANILKLY